MSCAEATWMRFHGPPVPHAHGQVIKLAAAGENTRQGSHACLSPLILGYNFSCSQSLCHSPLPFQTSPFSFVISLLSPAIKSGVGAQGTLLALALLC